MTAEIAVMNKNGIALAADSAVSFEIEGGIKVFPSANKLFTLSKYEPVGVMIYSSAQMAGLPWETVIKTYREQLGSTKFSHINDYTYSFIEFLESNTNLYPEYEQDAFAEKEIQSVLQSIRRMYFSEVVNIMTGISKNKIKDPNKLLADIVQTNYYAIKKIDFFQDKKGNKWSKERIKGVHKKYLKKIRSLRDDIYSDINIDADIKRKLTEIGKMALTRAIGGMGYTGLVIAGYGAKQFFPSINVLELFGFVDGHLRLVRRKSKETTIDTKNDATIIPFAQSEMVTTFMEGVDPSYQVTINRAIETALEALSNSLIQTTQLNWSEEYKTKIVDDIRNAVFNRLLETMKEERWKHFIRPVVSVVSSLPKTELASMAESLVNLTSMKRRISSASETVGGPIDVALISKGDGFIWIKRKHYFNKDLNYQFFANYFRKGGNNENEDTPKK